VAPPEVAAVPAAIEISIADVGCDAFGRSCDDRRASAIDTSSESGVCDLASPA
jgi:hypothetical protein